MYLNNIGKSSVCCHISVPQFVFVFFFCAVLSIVACNLRGCAVRKWIERYEYMVMVECIGSSTIAARLGHEFGRIPDSR